MAKRIKISDIADTLNISPTTVSFVLNNRQDKGISERTRQKVLEQAEKLGYRKLAKTNLVGWTRVAYLSDNLQFFNFYTSFFAGVYNHLQQKSPQNKLEIFLMEFNLKKKSEYAYNRLQEIRNLDIQVFITSNRSIADYLLKHKMKVIFIQGGSVLANCVNVYCDDYNAGKLAAKHALAMGHRTAGMIFPRYKGARYDGFYEYYTQKGGRCPDNYIWIITMDHDSMIKELQKRSKTTTLPTLFYCFADNLLFPVIKAFNSNGIRVPEDVSLIGTDNLYWGRYNSPAFTTVDLSEELFAEKVIDAIKHVVADGVPYNLAVPVKLIPRETVTKQC